MSEWQLQIVSVQAPVQVEAEVEAEACHKF